MDLGLQIDEAEYKKKNQRRNYEEFFHCIVDLRLLCSFTNCFKIRNKGFLSQA